MGIRLSILSWWTPKYIIRRELTNIYVQTTTALQELIAQYSDKEMVTNTKQPLSNRIEEQRTNMAQIQAEMVEILEAAIGHEKAIKLGRDALFVVGQTIGKQTRFKLGVNDNTKDLTKAAKILYRILGIEFQLEWLDNSNAVAIINRCALAEQYSKLTCEVLSATDEGVIKGLNPRVTMRFKEYMTSGCKNCQANIHFNKTEGNI